MSIAVETFGGHHKALNCVWDVDSLSVVYMTQPGGSTGGGGDASAANQTTEIAKLTSIDGKLTGLSTETTLAAIKAQTDKLTFNGSSALTITGGASGGGDASAANQTTEIAALGAPADAEATGNGSIIAVLKRIRTLLGGALSVTGTFWQSVQPVSGTFWQTTQPVSGTFWQATQPVSGTVTANQGAAGAAAWLTTDAADGTIGSAVPAKALYNGGTDGTNLQGLATASATNLTGTSSKNVLATVSHSTWNISHRPAAATKATATKAAGAAGVRHIVRGFTASLAIVGTAQAAAIQVDVIDGVSGGATRLWSGVLGGGAVNSNQQICVTDICLVGTAATALTIEFSAAGATATVEAVSLWGFSTT